jgi:hypothetical protein
VRGVFYNAWRVISQAQLRNYLQPVRIISEGETERETGHKLCAQFSSQPDLERRSVHAPMDGLERNTLLITFFY